MAKRIFVGNLKWTVDDKELASIFKEIGVATYSSVAIDRDTHKSRGFGFVEFATDEEAQEAIRTFSGKDYYGRALTVNEARPGVGATDRLSIDISIQMGAFCKGAEIGNSYGFKIGGRHFTVTCDNG